MEIKDREAVVALAVHPEIRGEARNKTLEQYRKLSSADLMEIIEEMGLLEECVASGVIGMTTHERLEGYLLVECRSYRRGYIGQTRGISHFEGGITGCISKGGKTLVG